MILELQELQERQDPEAQVLLAQQVHKERRGLQVLEKQVLQVLLDLKVLQVLLDHKEQLEQLVVKVLQGAVVQRAPQVLLVLLARTVRMEILAHQVPPVQVVLQEQQDPKVLPEQPEQMGRLVQLAHKVQLGRRVLLELLGREKLGPQVQLGRQEQLVLPVLQG